MDDPVSAAGGCKGMKTDRRQVSAGCLSTASEYLPDIRVDLVDPLRKLGDQMAEKRSRLRVAKISDLRINVFGNLFDGREDRNYHAVGAVNFVGCDFKAVIYT